MGHGLENREFVLLDVSAAIGVPALDGQGRDGGERGVDSPSTRAEHQDSRYGLHPLRLSVGVPALSIVRIGDAVKAETGHVADPDGIDAQDVVQQAGSGIQIALVL